MKRRFTYPVKLTKQKEGGYLVVFPHLPEAITQGESVEDALEQATDCLEEAIAKRIELNRRHIQTKTGLYGLEPFFFLSFFLAIFSCSYIKGLIYPIFHKLKLTSQYYHEAEY